jgi:hypothetical protein
MQFDSATRPRQPFLHKLGVTITRVVQKDMDECRHRIKRFDRFQQIDCRGGVDGFDFDHPGFPGLKVNCAMNVDALTPARLLDRELVLFWRPTADWPRRCGFVGQIVALAATSKSRHIAVICANLHRSRETFNVLLSKGLELRLPAKRISHGLRDHA